MTKDKLQADADLAYYTADNATCSQDIADFLIDKRVNAETEGEKIITYLDIAPSSGRAPGGSSLSGQ